jgi:glutathione S-transferase
MRGMRIFHIATLADWKEAESSGTYRTSTYGRTLEQEGFIHAAHHDQVPAVRDRYYADVSEPLLVLEVETDLLDAEVRDEAVDDEVYPHVYGPIPTDAVVAWRPARPPVFEAQPPKEPAPPLTRAFRGAAVVLAAAALALFTAASVAQGPVDDDEMAVELGFLLWTLTITAGVSALAAFAVSALVDRRDPQAD